MASRRSAAVLVTVTACGAALAGAVVATGGERRVAAVPVAAAQPAWRGVPTPAPLTDGALNKVDVVSARLAWAVGVEQARAAIFRWDGERWRRQQSPGGFIPADVAASGPRSAWAAGPGGAVHWNGSAWRKVPVPSGVGTISALAAAPDGSAWAVAGNVVTKSSSVLRWSSGRWTKVSVPLPARASLASVGVRAKNDVWVAGTANDVSLAMRWNGRKWTRVRLPPPLRSRPSGASGVVKIHPVAAGNVWALRGPQAAALLHWNGQRWSQTALPSGHFALTLAEDGAGGVWVIPYTDASDTIRKSYYLHWNGRAWRKVHGPGRAGNAQLGDLDRIPGTTSLFSVGAVQQARRKIPFIERYR